MLELTCTQFGALIGVSRQAISKRIEKGDLEKSGSRIDPRHPTNAAFLTAHGIDPETLQPVQAPGPAGPRPHPTADDPDAPDPEAWKKPNASRAELEREKLRRQIRKLAVETSYKENRLIDREELGRIVQAIAAEMISQVRTLGITTAPDICAALGINDPAREIEAAKILDCAGQNILTTIHRNVSVALKEKPPDKEDTTSLKESKPRNRRATKTAAKSKPVTKTKTQKQGGKQ